MGLYKANLLTKMNTMKFIAMHHSGGFLNDIYAPSQHLTWQQINKAHRQRWNFVSSLGFYGGYNFFIDKAGGITQFRAIGEETAAQLGHNFDTVSICVAGNFIQRNGVPIEIPTDAQKKAVIDLITFCLGYQNFNFIPKVMPSAAINISLSTVHHHGFYSSTECDCLPDSYWRDEYARQTAPKPDVSRETQAKETITIIDALIKLFEQLKAHLQILFAEKKVGAVDRECCRSGIILP